MLEREAIRVKAKREAGGNGKGKGKGKAGSGGGGSGGNGVSPGSISSGCLGAAKTVALLPVKAGSAAATQVHEKETERAMTRVFFVSWAVFLSYHLLLTPAFLERRRTSWQREPS